MSAEMTPDEWQNYCHQLARLRHGAGNYQPVPDHDRGDLGIESFALDGSGHAYQFYVAEATDTAGLFEAQKRKLARDLAKLAKNDEKLVLLLGFPIKRWILVVPKYDSKRIVEAATAKTQEIAAEGLACVDPADFRVLVQDESAFALESAALRRGGVATAPMPQPEVAEGEIEAWAIDNAAEVEKLDEKLRKLIARHYGSGEDRAALKQQLLTAHLKGQNYAELLETRYPELYEQFVRAKAAEESDLELRSLTTSSSPQGHVTEVRLQYEQRLKVEVPGLDADDERVLSWAGVAEWMIRCPLNFPESQA